MFGVDLVIESNHKYYERSWPKYKGVKTNLEDSYNQPRAPVEVVLGLKHGDATQGPESSSNSSLPEPRELHRLELHNLYSKTIWQCHHMPTLKSVVLIFGLG